MLLFSPKYLFLFPGAAISLGGLALTILLHLRTIYVFGMPLGLSAAVFAGALSFIGVQIALFGIYSLVFNTSRSWSEDDSLSHFLRRNFTLERGLLIGGVILAVGAAMSLTTIYLIVNFAKNLPYVDIPLARLAIVSVFVILLGLQVIFSSFYVSLFNLAETLK